MCPDIYALDIQLFPRYCSASWFLSYVLVQNVTTRVITYFPAHQWIRCEDGKPKKFVLIPEQPKSYK